MHNLCRRHLGRAALTIGGTFGPIVVVDGGSVEDTVEIANHSGATVLRDQNGRASEAGTGRSGVRIWAAIRSH